MDHEARGAAGDRLLIEGPVSEIDRVPDLTEVRGRIEPYVLRTPVVWSPALSERCGVPVHLKLECLQRTGSFKLRGAAAKMTSLSDEERSRGVVTCSSGNHGRAVAHMARELGLHAAIYVPEWVDPVKAAGMKAAGAEVVIGGDSYDEADRRAAARAEADGLTFVHPFDDPWVIAGQGTVGLEMAEQDPGAMEWLVCLSGGGLVAGIAVAARRLSAEGGVGRRVVSASATQAAVMLASLDAGRPIELPEEETLANALAGGIGLENRWSFPLVRDLVDQHVQVSEEQIADAMRFAGRELGLVVEGGGAVGLAALLSGVYEPQGPTTVVLSGANVDPGVWAGLLDA